MPTHSSRVWGSFLSWVCATFHTFSPCFLQVLRFLFTFPSIGRLAGLNCPLDVNKPVNMSGRKWHSIRDKFSWLGRSVPEIGSGSTVTPLMRLLKMNERRSCLYCICESVCVRVSVEFTLKPWSPRSDMLLVGFHLRVTCDINFHNGLWWHQGGGTLMRADSTS